MSARRLVVKFGGSVLRSGRDVEVAARLVAEAPAEEKLVVVSAPFGLTDRLLGLAREVDEPIAPADEAGIVSYGERISADLLSAQLRRRGVPVEVLAPEDPDWPVLTRGGPTDADLDPEATRDRVVGRLPPRLAERVVVLPGFLGWSGERVTTLRRGGSDTSALALAHFLGATDVVLVKGAPGVLTADPRVVPDARLIPELDVAALGELVRAGLPVVAKEALPYLGPGPTVRVIPLGAPLLGAGGTLVRASPPPPVAPALQESPSVAAVTATLGPSTDGLGELVRILGGRRWLGLSATGTSVTIFVPEGQVDRLVRTLHESGAFAAVTSRKGVPNPRTEGSSSWDQRTAPNDAASPAPTRAGRATGTRAAAPGGRTAPPRSGRGSH